MKGLKSSRRFSFDCFFLHMSWYSVEYAHPQRLRNFLLTFEFNGHKLGCQLISTFIERTVGLWSKLWVYDACGLWNDGRGNFDELPELLMELAEDEVCANRISQVALQFRGWRIRRKRRIQQALEATSRSFEYECLLATIPNQEFDFSSSQSVWFMARWLAP